MSPSGLRGIESDWTGLRVNWPSSLLGLNESRLKRVETYEVHGFGGLQGVDVHPVHVSLREPLLHHIIDVLGGIIEPLIGLGGYLGWLRVECRRRVGHTYGGQRKSWKSARKMCQIDEIVGGVRRG